MSEYFTKPLNNMHCKDKYAIGHNNGDFFVICESDQEAHKLSLAFLMKKVPTPTQDESMYEFAFEICGSKYYYERGSRPDDAADINSCCMSGCTGCPTYENSLK